jgi:PAS domain S-box-containing protein
MDLENQRLLTWPSHDQLPSALAAFVHGSQDMVVVLDAELNYLAMNETACRLLRKTEAELIGKNLLDVFPQLTASTSHRMLLQTISSGEIAEGVLTQGTFTRQGAQYSTDYYPLQKDGRTKAVLAVTKTLYYPS